MARRKKINIKIILIISLLFSIIVATSYYFNLGNNLFSVSETVNNNQYYEDRCIDVSDYYEDGYTLYETDDNGCERVEKDLLIGRIEYGAMTPVCGDGSTNRNYCVERYGNSYNIQRCEHYAYWSRSSALVCYTTTKDYKGGTEKVLNTCTFDLNDIQIAETFYSGETINKLATKYPIKKFCKAHPAIVSIPANKETQTSTNIYDAIINGEDFIVPIGQQVTIFYNSENNFDLPTKCNTNGEQALDVETNECITTSHLAYICSGSFDSLRGICFAEQRVECEDDRALYDVEKDACVYFAPQQADCSIYGDNYYYSVDRDSCVGYPDKDYKCGVGEFLEPKSQYECNLIDGVWEECPQCASDEVCPDSICSPTCSIGQTCFFNNFDDTFGVDIDDCESYEESGLCEINDTEIGVYEIDLCPNEDSVLQYVRYIDEFGCVNNPIVEDICQDGSKPYQNSLTGVYECLEDSVINGINCPVDKPLYDPGKKQCVSNVVVYDPDDETKIIYEEVITGCTKDIDCEDVGNNMKCNVASGYCYTSDKVFEDINENTTITKTIIQAFIVLIISFTIIISFFLYRRKR